MSRTAYVTVIGSWAILSSLAFAQAGEFLTPEVRVDANKSTPLCSSTFGCFLSGVALPAANNAVKDIPVPPDPTNAARTEIAAHAPIVPARKIKSKRVAPITIATDPMAANRMRDLVALMPGTDIKIIVKAPGSPARPGTDFSVLTAIDGRAPPDGAKANLFTAQLYILAGRQVHSVKDLKDQIVSFGPEGSASQATAREAFAALKIAVRETPLDLENALDGLSSGDVAAVVVLAPEPIKQIEDLPGQGLHLVTWPSDIAPPPGMNITAMDRGRYPRLANQAQTLQILDVDTFIEENEKSDHRRDEAFLLALLQHSPVLSRRGFDLIVTARQHALARTAAR